MLNLKTHRDYTSVVMWCIAGSSKLAQTFPHHHYSDEQTQRDPSKHSSHHTMFHQLSSLSTGRRKRKYLLLHLPDELLLLIAANRAPCLRELNSLLRCSRFLCLLLTPLRHTMTLSAAERHGCSVIRTTAARGNTELLQHLLWLAKGVGVNVWEPISWTTALHAAVMLERSGAVTVLLAHGAGIESFDHSRWAALH